MTQIGMAFNHNGLLPRFLLSVGKADLNESSEKTLNKYRRQLFEALLIESSSGGLTIYKWNN